MEASSNSREQNSEIESAVRNLLGLIRRHSNPQTHGNSNSSPTVGPQPGTSASFGVGQAVSRPNTVQQEMQRAFPALYHGSRKRMKKMAPEPAKVTSVKFLEFQFCLLSKNSQKTPKDETVLLQAGLGRRTVNIPDNADHTEITKVLLQEYPKLQNLRGGCLLQKASGGSGQRKTTSLAQDSQGYTTKILKASSNNGKNVIYIVPLQEKIDITPLPYDAPEFHNMPKNICMTCGTSVPLQLLPCHLEDCQSNNADACPICGEEFSAEVMPYHASTCGESFPEIFPTIMDGNSVDESASSSSQTSTRPQSTTFQLDPDHLTPGPSVTAESAPSVCDDWKRIELPERAAIMYRRYTLRQKEDEPSLKVRIDIREDMEDQEGRIINFYKAPKIDWTRPLQCRLEGDVATGDGVQRHFFSMVMHKLQNGFLFNVGDFPVWVYCQMISDGKEEDKGGWTVIQRRMDGSVNFYRPWKEYKRGFGNVEGEYWLGLENMYQLTRNRKYMLRVDLEDFEKRKGSALYSSFSVDCETDGYKLHVSGFKDGGAGDSLSFHNEQKFTTFDKDQDTYENNCAKLYLGAFWYATCHQANPNGVYLWGEDPTIFAIGDVWYTWKNNYAVGMKSISMKIKRVS